jgi:radical SAM protein with 4Fe4S-binding SPASM domain
MNKDFLLNDSKTFCMFPWVHLNATPKGDVYPCCSNDYTDPVGNTKDNTLAEIFNSPKMKELRVDMLNERKNKICDFCYKHEEAGPYSFRNYSKEQFANRFDEIVPTTQEDGTVDEFKMRYFDIRFSNICNFKCRTCGSEFSSKWGEEMKKNYDPNHPVLIHVDDNKGTVLDEVLEHIEHIDLAYFAGGEPLITDEHYTMLEAMIRKGRTDITLRYNTNASNIKYKKHDILDLWKHFKKIELSCSIDHYGERAEYMRKGTDWGKVEENLLTFRDLDYVIFQMNTVFSIYNYSTIGDFYQYLKDTNIVRTEDWYHSLYLAVHPNYYCAKSNPK